jgi:hypothetical protein
MSFFSSVFFSFALGVGEVKGGKFFTLWEKQTQHNKNEPSLVCPRLSNVTQASIHSGQVNFATEYWWINQRYLLIALAP